MKKGYRKIRLIVEVEAKDDIRPHELRQHAENVLNTHPHFYTKLNPYKLRFRVKLFNNWLAMKRQTYSCYNVQQKPLKDHINMAVLGLTALSPDPIDHYVEKLSKNQRSILGAIASSVECYVIGRVKYIYKGRKQ